MAHYMSCSGNGNGWKRLIYLLSIIRLAFTHPIARRNLENENPLESELSLCCSDSSDPSDGCSVSIDTMRSDGNPRYSFSVVYRGVVEYWQIFGLIFPRFTFITFKWGDARASALTWRMFHRCWCCQRWREKSLKLSPCRVRREGSLSVLDKRFVSVSR